MKNNNVLNVSGLHNPVISSKKTVFVLSKPKKGNLSKLRARIDTGKEVHYLFNVDSLFEYFSVDTCLKLLNDYSHSGFDCCASHMKNGFVVEIFKI